jgi:adenosylhomocysteine nucleosidase
VTDLVFDDPCILFALRREAQPFLREFRPQQRFSGAPCWARFCGPPWLCVLTLQMGIGQERAESALTWILGRPILENVPYKPKLVLSAGFSGALTEDRRIGDVVLATEVADLAGNAWPVTWPGELPGGEWRPALHRGRILSTTRLIGDPEEKRELGKRYGAVAVDMETATIARRCLAHHIPFGCVRAISDDIRTALSPRLTSLLSRRRISPLRLTSSLIRSPRMVAELWRLYGHTRYAAKQLAVALGELLTLTLPEQTA